MSRRAQLRLLGVTGTNGKTTTVGMLRHLLDERGRRARASIGTLGVLVGGDGEPHRWRRRAHDAGPGRAPAGAARAARRGVRTVAMEASSHALASAARRRARVRGGVFTNLTRDHLDYHGTMEAYFDAKALLVELARAATASR